MDNKNPKTIYITRFPFFSQLGGEELHTLSVAKHYRTKGHTVIFLSSCPVLKDLAQKNDFKFQELWFYKAPVSIFSLLIFTLLYPFLLLKAWILISKLPQKNKTHFYMLSFGEKLIFTPLTLKYKISTIWLEHSGLDRWFTKNPWSQAYKYLSKSSSLKIVTVSKKMINNLQIKNVILIPNAINSAFFTKIRDVTLLPPQLKSYLQDGKIHITSIGRFTKAKGMRHLIKAAEKLPEYVFIAAGGGPLQSELNKAGIKTYPQLNRQEVVTLMQNSDIFILPSSEFESFGLVALEAMASGTAVIVSENCGISDYLQNGIDSIISPLNKITENIEKLSKDESLRKQIAENGQHTAIKNFDLKKMFDSYDKLLK